jgi:hypothetical protein
VSEKSRSPGKSQTTNSQTRNSVSTTQKAHQKFRILRLLGGSSQVSNLSYSKDRHLLASLGENLNDCFRTDAYKKFAKVSGEKSGKSSTNSDSVPQSGTNSTSGTNTGSGSGSSSEEAKKAEEKKLPWLSESYLYWLDSEDNPNRHLESYEGFSREKADLLIWKRRLGGLVYQLSPLGAAWDTYAKLQRRYHELPLLYEQKELRKLKHGPQNGFKAVDTLSKSLETLGSGSRIGSLLGVTLRSRNSGVLEAMSHAYKLTSVDFSVLTEEWSDLDSWSAVSAGQKFISGLLASPEKHAVIDLLARNFFSEGPSAEWEARTLLLALFPELVERFPGKKKSILLSLLIVNDISYGFHCQCFSLNFNLKFLFR